MFAMVNHILPRAWKPLRQFTGLPSGLPPANMSPPNREPDFRQGGNPTSAIVQEFGQLVSHLCRRDDLSTLNRVYLRSERGEQSRVGIRQSELRDQGVAAGEPEGLRVTPSEDRSETLEWLVQQKEPIPNHQRTA